MHNNTGGALETPVVFIFFNRPDTTRRTLAAIREVRPTKLYLIQDGPRANVPGEKALVEVTRNAAEEVDWDCDVVPIYSEVNLGLRQRVTTGLDQVFSTEERAIILEDDCLANPSFFRFTDELLDRFADDERIGTISGNNFLRGNFVSTDSYFFSPDVRIWGWGTWSRVWQDFSANGLDYKWSQSEASAVLSGFPSPTRRKNLLRMADQSTTLDSWALPFVLHEQRRGHVSVVPEVNLVKNIGFGGRSTHTRFESFTDEIPTKRLEFPLRHPDAVVVNDKAGKLEHALHRKLWLTFPFRHPLDFVGRVLRYLFAR
jgi:hypothetical protein